MKSLALALVVALVAGCTTPAHNYQAQAQSVSYPPLNQVHEAEVGEEMVKHGKFVVRDAIYLPAALEISWYKVSAGYFKKVGETADGEFFQPGGAADAGTITQRGIADAPQALFVRRRDKVLCVITVFSLSSCFRTGVDGSAEGYERRRKTDFAEDSLQQVLIYNGGTGGKITVGYREFSGTSQAPVSNSVEYDLGSSREIAYRGARIEVLEATNTMIKYKVLQGFDSAGQ